MLSIRPSMMYIHLFLHQIWGNVTLHHLDPLQWMGAVRESKQLIKTSQATLVQSINPSVHRLMSCEVKSCMFVRNKSIIKAFLSVNCCFWLKCESIIMLPYVKKILFSSHIKIHPHICLDLFLLVNNVWSVHISLLIQTRQLFHWNKKTKLWMEDSNGKMS